MHRLPSSVAEAAELLRTRSLTALELTGACLANIKAQNPALNAFITVMEDHALAEAEAADRAIAGGSYRGPLHGIPIALKDNIDTAGVRTTAASAVFAERVPAADAEVVRRLRAAGAVILGKTNLHEFAYGGSSVISHFGPVRNPLDPTRVAGGSSGGSAAAVGSGMCVAALGSDTAGSIRLPAAVCGLVGFKPTFDAVSCEGVIPLSWTYDHVGPITRCVADARMLFEVLTASSQPPESVAQLRVGIARKYFCEALEPVVEAAFSAALAAMQALGWQLRDVEIPVDEDRTVAKVESWRYHEPMVRERAHLYHPETLRRIRTGEGVSGEEFDLKMRELQRVRASAAALFRDVDIIVTPTSPILPPSLERMLERPDELRPSELLMLRNTRPFNALGVPAISVPCGQMCGVQLAAAPHRDYFLLDAADALEHQMLMPASAK